MLLKDREERLADWNDSVSFGFRLPEFPVDRLGPNANHSLVQIDVLAYEPGRFLSSKAGVDVGRDHCVDRGVVPQYAKLLTDLPERQEPDLRRRFHSPLHPGGRVRIAAVSASECVVLDGVGKEPVECLPHQVGGLGRPAVLLNPGGEESADDLGRDVLQELSLDVLPGISIPGRLGGDVAASLRAGCAWLEGLADGAEEDSQAAEVVLVGLVAAGGPEMSAEVLKGRREGQLACHVEVAQGQFVLDSLELARCHSMIGGPEWLSDAFAVDVVAHPELIASFAQRSHDSLPFSSSSGIYIARVYRMLSLAGFQGDDVRVMDTIWSHPRINAKKQEQLTRCSYFTYALAGAGFEPATSGL